MKSRNVLVWLLFLIGIICRALPHPPNVTPVTGIALFAGSQWPAPLALSVPLLIMIATDLLFYGFHKTVFFTWTAMAVIALLGRLLRKTIRPGMLLAVSLGSSLWFYLWTNFGHWLMVGDYPQTFPGLIACYVAGIPFFRNSLLGDLVYTAAFFGIYAAALRPERVAEKS